MGLKPGKCYRKLERPNTRVSKRRPRKSYVKGVPGSKIRQFEMGNRTADYDNVIYLIAKESVQIRHNALEAARMAITQRMNKALGKQATYFLKLRLFPHHVLRENQLATGAGADRFQQGMRMSFGRPIGTAVQVKKGQILLELRLKKSSIDAGKRALNVATKKLPLKCQMQVNDMKQ
jgi:large subunit ribosomal protein L10e